VIRLTRFDGTTFVVNCDLIQYVEATPDTIVTLTTRDKIMVREGVAEVVEAVIEFKGKVFRGELAFERDPDEEIIE